MKERDDRIEGAAEVRRANVTDLAGEGSSGFRRGVIVGRMRHGHHLRAPFDAVHVEAHRSKEAAMAASAGAKLKQRPRVRKQRIEFFCATYSASAA